MTGVVQAAAPVASRDTATEEERRPSVVVLTLATAVAFAIGISPWFDITDRPWAVGVLAVEWLLLGVVRARVLITASDRHPRPWELALGVVSSLFPASLLSAFALLAYGAGLGVAQILVAAGVDVDTARGALAEDLAFASSFVIALSLCAGCAAIATDNTSRQLYPRTAGMAVAFRTLFAEKRRRRTAVAAALPVLVAGAATLALPSNGWVLLTQVLVLAWSLTVFRLGQMEHAPEHDQLARALHLAFLSADYLVVESPRTGDPALDPLVVGVDLLAYREERAFAVQIEAAKTSESRVPWADAAAVGLAATTLADVAWQLDVRTGRVEPVLVVTGEEPGSALRKFCEREGVALMVLQDTGPGALDDAVAELSAEAPL